MSPARALRHSADRRTALRSNWRAVAAGVLEPSSTTRFWEHRRPMAGRWLPRARPDSAAAQRPNWSWHEYGMRSALAFFISTGGRGIRPTVAINARVARNIPRRRGGRRAGWSSWALPTSRARSTRRTTSGDDRTLVSRPRTLTGTPALGLARPLTDADARNSATCSGPPRQIYLRLRL